MAGLIRVVLDTNSWISSYINPYSPLAQLLKRLVRSPTIEALFSQPLREEILRVLRRPKFGKYFSAERLAVYESDIQAFLLTEVHTEVLPFGRLFSG